MMVCVCVCVNGAQNLGEIGKEIRVNNSREEWKIRRKERSEINIYFSLYLNNYELKRGYLYCTHEDVSKEITKGF